MQDSNTDWEREASTMRYVYSHSTCNIAASAAAGQDSGLFRPRREKEVLPGTVTSLLCPSATEQNFLLFDKG